jgi:hypothetical protein
MSTCYDAAVETVVQAKEDAVAAMRDDDPGDIAPFERDGQLLATARASDVDRDEGLAIALIGVSGYHADAVLWVADAHMTTEPINPNTGKPWGPGEMQNACDNDGACAVGLLRDCLLIVRYERGLGITHNTQMPYVVDKEARVVRWDSAERRPEPNTSQGFIVDVLADAFTNTPHRIELVAAGALPLDRADRQQGLVDQLTTATLRALNVKVTPAARTVRTEA